MRRRRAVQVGERGDSLLRLFYANYGLVVSTYPVCIQGVFDILTRLFGRVRLRNILGRHLGRSTDPDARLVPSMRRLKIGGLWERD